MCSPFHCATLPFEFTTTRPTPTASLLVFKRLSTEYTEVFSGGDRAGYFPRRSVHRTEWGGTSFLFPGVAAVDFPKRRIT
jgi:hypothetical protein